MDSLQLQTATAMKLAIINAWINSKNTLQKRNTDLMYWKLEYAGLRPVMSIAMAVAVNNNINYY
ncbi:hypothetical protein DPMN_089421 [Dreissena polymorpha]|uniref:Uncharacterized protein n=1 Tax=Dreissena polymorpha TaxID=45954 RepID=A0A9D4KXT9_DREPO|nr:hypothetical protein DPMN_089421 [Dreissena polymorpha]